MNTQLARSIQKCLTGLAAFGLAAHAAQAQTVIAGPTIPTSTWSPSGNPYLIVSDCTVPSGATLTILPGTIVQLGPGISLTGIGAIQAEGTLAERIRFQAVAGSANWNSILVKNTAGTNRFTYCDFSDSDGNALDCRGRNELLSCTFSNCYAGLALRGAGVNRVQFCDFQNVAYGAYLTVVGVNLAQTNAIRNCTFTKCASESVYGEAQGTEYYGGCSSRLSLSIANCVFESVNDGCKLRVFGAYYIYNPFQHYTSYGYGDAQIIGNIFRNVTNTAFLLTVGSYAGGGPATLLNNVVAGAAEGVVVQAPWDATVQGCIFKGCDIGIARSGTLSATISYNDFYSNATNFSGYPATYGHPTLSNRNGTASDMLFNIFEDPGFVSATDFHLQSTSTCIDAGPGGSADFDACSPPSLGSVTNDIGSYGGRNSCGWEAQGKPPQITSQPTSQSSCLGGDAVFLVTVAGTSPLRPQWYHGPTLLPGQTNATLTLTNLQDSDAGAYQVVISNDYGSTSSLPAQLVVNDACVDLKMYAGLSIAGQVGQTYVLKYTTDVNETNFVNWTPLATNTMRSSDWFYLDRESPFSPKRFYGVKKQ